MCQVTCASPCDADAKGKPPPPPPARQRPSDDWLAPTHTHTQDKKSMHPAQPEHTSTHTSTQTQAQHKHHTCTTKGPHWEPTLGAGRRRWWWPHDRGGQASSRGRGVITSDDDVRTSHAPSHAPLHVPSMKLLHVGTVANQVLVGR